LYEQTDQFYSKKGGRGEEKKDKRNTEQWSFGWRGVGGGRTKEKIKR